jgi:hypothetical protein
MLYTCDVEMRTKIGVCWEEQVMGHANYIFGFNNLIMVFHCDSSFRIGVDNALDNN